MSACTKHAAKSVRGYSDCPGCEVENLRQQLAVAQAEAQVLRERSMHVDRAATRLAIEKDTLAQKMTRVHEIVSGMRKYADSCDHLAYWLAQLEDALSPTPEPRSTHGVWRDGEWLPCYCLADHDHGIGSEQLVKHDSTEQHDPLAVSDHCPECSEPEPECACEEQPDEHESLPLMARREWMFMGARYAFRDWDSVWFQSVHKPGRVWRFCYRIADTDENGFPVIERTTDMPEGAKYRITLGSGRVIYQNAPKGVGFVGFVDTTRCERIEDYCESG